MTHLTTEQIEAMPRTDLDRLIKKLAASGKETTMIADKERTEAVSEYTQLAEQWAICAVTANEYEHAALRSAPGSVKHTYLSSHGKRWEHEQHKAGAQMEAVGRVATRSGAVFSPADIIHNANKKAEKQRKAIQQHIYREVRTMNDYGTSSPA